MTKQFWIGEMLLSALDAATHFCVIRPMPIYRRTALGNEAAMNPDSPLPRKLRTLLIAVDGRTRVGTYVNSLGSFGDVSALLESLHQAGLVEKLSAHNAPQAQFATTESQRETPSSWRTTDFGGRAIGKAPVSSLRARDANRSASDDETDAMSTWGLSQAPTAAVSFGKSFTETRPAGNTAQYQLRNAIQLMSDFVTRHLPEQSLEIVLSLETLGSVEQVLSSLQGYEALISPIGAPAQRHLAELRTALATF